MAQTTLVAAIQVLVGMMLPGGSHTRLLCRAIELTKHKKDPNTVALVGRGSRFVGFPS
jgi:hypothetical protein